MTRLAGMTATLYALLTLSACSSAPQEPPCPADMARDDGSAHREEMGSSDKDMGEMGSTPPDIWANIKNRCAPAFDGEVDPRDDWGGPVQPPPETITAEVLWQRRVACPELGGDEPLGDLFTEPGSLALGRYKGEQALFSVMDSPWEGHFYGRQIHAYAWLKPASGEVVDCLKPQPLAGIASSPVVLVPGLGDAPIVSTISWHMKEADGKPRSSWWSSAWQNAPQLPERPSEIAVPANAALMPDGQYIFMTDDYIASIDSKTGILSWLVRRAQLYMASKSVGFGPVRAFSTANLWFEQSTRTLFVRGIKRSADDPPQTTVAISSCGEVSGRQPTVENVRHIRLDEGSFSVTYDEGGFTLRAPQDVAKLTCANIVSLDTRTMLCVEPLDIHTSLKLATMSTDGTIKRFILDTTTLGTPNNVIFEQDLVALRERSLAIRAYEYDNANLTRQQLLFVDWSTGALLHKHTLPEITDMLQPALVDDSGRLIYTHTGEVIVVQTNTTGLSPTPIPRGIRWGRNRNLGSF